MVSELSVIMMITGSSDYCHDGDPLAHARNYTHHVSELFFGTMSRFIHVQQMIVAEFFAEWLLLSNIRFTCV